MRKKTIMMHIVKIQISKVIDCQGFIISLSWVLKIVRIKFFESLMFVPHGGGGLVSIQFSSLVTNTATDPRPRALTRFYLPWSMTAALLVLFSSDYLSSKTSENFLWQIGGVTIRIGGVLNVLSNLSLRSLSSWMKDLLWRNSRMSGLEDILTVNG